MAQVRDAQPRTRPGRAIAAVAAAAVVAALLAAAPAGPTTPAAADGNEAPGNPVAFRSITAGAAHTCAITASRTVKCWGSNWSGQLGLGDTSDRGDGPGEMGADLPNVNLGTGRTATAITAGYHDTCAILDNGSVKCWGYNPQGGLGLGDQLTRGDQPGEMGDNLPAVDLGTGRTATAITAGRFHNCALLDNNTVKCWGGGGSPLGIDDVAPRGDVPGEMGDNLPAVDLGTGRTATAITAGTGHTCAILDDHSVKCWGGNLDGQLGLGDTADRGGCCDEMGDNLPTVNLGTGRTATAIAAGGEHTCALLDNATVKCWGWNDAGALGLGGGSRGDQAGEMGDNLPTVNLGTGRTATAITAGGPERPNVWEEGQSGHTCALLDNAAIKCWGNNYTGQLGYGDNSNRGANPGGMGDNLPAVDLGAGRTAIAITTGEFHTCALLDNHTLKCWGHNAYGQLGQGDRNHRGNTPGEMGDLLPAVAIGPDQVPLIHTHLPRTTRGVVGDTVTMSLLVMNESAVTLTGLAAGPGCGSLPASLPAGQSAQTTCERALAAGDVPAVVHTVTVTLDQRAPVPTSGLVLVERTHPQRSVSVAAGSDHTCALHDNGAVKCWGANPYGQLGQGDRITRGDGPGETGDNLPTVDLGTGRTATAITAGDGYTCALLDSGDVKCWGINSQGWLGLGHRLTRGDQPGEMGDSLPTVDLGTGRTATAITAGSAHVCALLDNHTLKCWGTGGTIGLGDTLSRGDGPGEMGDNLPTVDLGTGRTATAITSGDLYTCALLDNSTVKCWGRNSYGQLGLGDTLTRGDQAGEMGDNLPTVDLGTGRTATAITAGGGDTCALLDNHTVKCWGYNQEGRLGLGDTLTRGDQAGEMGDNLPTVDLGTGRTATALAASRRHICALLDDHTVKCWGDNGSGRLGQGDTTDRGDQPGEMGDNLTPVNLGTGRTATTITTGSDHTCALLDNGTIKCWGGNANGELGLWDTAYRGDQVGEMGDALPIVDLGTEASGVGGRVVDAVTGEPVAHGWVAVLDAGDYRPVGAAYTTADGWFATTIAPGTYRLYVIDPTGDHTPGLHPTPVTVNPEALTGTQITMAPTRGAITGTITTANTTTPIPGAVVLALNAANGTPGPFTTTGPDGTYTLPGLGPTPQRIVTLDPTGNHQPQFHHNTPFPLDATVITPGAGNTTTIDLDPPTATGPTGGATLTGSITGAGGPVPGTLIIALHANNLAYAAATTADPTGHYTLQLDPGTYRLAAIDPTGQHQAEWHPDHPFADLNNAPTHTLNPGNNTIDIGLAPLTGTITGTITNTTNQPITQAWAIAIDPTGAPTGHATTRPDGTYTIVGLPAGTYRLTLVDPHHGRPQTWWNQQTTYATATPITTTPGATTTANATLPDP